MQAASEGNELGGLPDTADPSRLQGSPKLHAITDSKEPQISNNLEVIPETGIHPKKENMVPIIEPTRPQISALSEDDEFWDTYLKEAEEYDREIIASWRSDLDSILIFAGLFSAVNTAFIVESYASLKADPADDTNTLLRILINRIDNTTFVGVDPSELLFVLSPAGVRNNAVFFASLATSLMAAFGAVLAKQWLDQYLRIGEARSARRERGRARQRKFEGLMTWKFQPVIEALPLLLQTSLVLFLIALIDFLWSLNRIVSSTVIVLTGLGVVFYMFTTMFSALYDDCPFQTPISHSLRAILRELRHSWSRIVRRNKPSSRSQGSHPTNIDVHQRSTEKIDAQAIAWLLKTVSELKPRLIATRAIRYLQAPAIHPYFADRETIGSLMASFASCFQDRRVHHDGAIVYTASPAVLDMVDAAGHALCRILSTAPHDGVQNANNPYPYADLLPSLEFSPRFFVEDLQGKRCYTAHHLSRVIKWMASGDVGNYDDENIVRIQFAGLGWDLEDGLGVSVQAPSNWEKLQFSHVVNRMLNCPGSIRGVQESLVFFCCKLLEQRPLPPLNVLCDVLLIPAWTATFGRELPPGIDIAAGLTEIQTARSSLSLNLCLLLFLEFASQPGRLGAQDLLQECTSKLLEDLAIHGIHIGGLYTPRYWKCAQILLNFDRQTPTTGPEPHNLRFTNAGLRIIDAIVPDLQSLIESPSTYGDEDVILLHLDALGARHVAFISGAMFSDTGHLKTLDRNVLSLLWALDVCVIGDQRQILPAARFGIYPNIPLAICYAMLVFRNTDTFPFPFNKKIQFPLRLLEECMVLWFDYRETNVHRLFINARFGEMLLTVIEESSVNQPSVHNQLDVMCRKLVHHLTSSRPDLWAPVFKRTSILHLDDMRKSMLWPNADSNLSNPRRWLSRLLLFWNIDTASNDFDINSLNDLWMDIVRKYDVQGEPGSSRDASTTNHPEGAQVDDGSHQRMLQLDGAIAYTYLAFAVNSLELSPRLTSLNKWLEDEYGKSLRGIVSWRLKQNCPEDIAALIRCIQQQLVPLRGLNANTSQHLDKDLGISTWNRYRERQLAYFADIDLHAPSLEKEEPLIISGPAR